MAESAPPALAALDRAWDTAQSAAAGDLGTPRIGYSLSAGAETAPALVDRLIRGNIRAVAKTPADALHWLSD
ncbi:MULTISPECIES: hypothetical protein [Frankia]|uniref:Uncharacterized protein n=1 Tax=Frankia alni (strain DSM 45986 / CECT 9034 / ACN14a) TaxID=326424 RepID=Q0RJI5_FRAAA|nr:MULTISPECIES: hypothetical protein [Frankia]CAJ62327.1 hypothetical protein FRAAL3684 [Frankia alni ACN14a]